LLPSSILVEALAAWLPRLPRSLCSCVLNQSGFTLRCLQCEASHKTNNEKLVTIRKRIEDLSHVPNRDEAFPEDGNPDMVTKDLLPSVPGLTSCGCRGVTVDRSLNSKAT